MPSPKSKRKAARRLAVHAGLLQWWATAAAAIDQLYRTADDVARAAADPKSPVFGLIDARRAKCLAADLCNASCSVFDAVPRPAGAVPEPLANC
jgi:hypothetical protein